MRFKGIPLLVLLLTMPGCVTDPPVSADTKLDDLTDKQEYTESFLVDCSTYQGKEVIKLLVNGFEYNDPNDILVLANAGYYRIEIYTGERASASMDLIRIVLLDPERGETEWGLPPWTPVEPEPVALNDQSVTLIYTRDAPPGVYVPLIVLVGEEPGLSENYMDAEIGTDHFSIKRGVGSIQIPDQKKEESLRIDSRSFSLDVSTINMAPVHLSGVLESDTQFPPYSYILIQDDLSVPEGISLSIGSGSFLSIDPEVNIINNGQVLITGAADAPVTVTCSDSESFWGGFIGHADSNAIEASYTIFSKSGYHSGGEYAYGHAGRQALFYSENGYLKLDHCYMIDHIGQVFYPVSSKLELGDCLVQRAKTGGQMNESELLMDRCIFTDFPDYSYEYRDEDNDGLYLDECNAVIRKSVFMFAKDDGLDSGASGGGEVLISNSIFEANFHEGAALSSGHSVIKLHRITNCLFINNGQGLELGYSSPNHLVDVDSCRFIENGIGIRYGDCYDFPHHGYIQVRNSHSLDNRGYDVWNMNREHWAADTIHMSFDNVVVSKANPMYPELITND